MRVVFRVDASGQIGAGHLSRCLTLADALRARGAQVRFVCRYIPESLAQIILSKHHELARLEAGTAVTRKANELAHSDWLGVEQEEDADQTASLLNRTGCDWLVVDHYALDARWERRLRRSAANILVIDDLADRLHDCDVLLDQNYYENLDTRYAGKTPEICQLLLGPRYALLRDEFRQARRGRQPRSGAAARILVFMGGVDATNFTSIAVQALISLQLEAVHVDVVLGAQHAKCSEIERVCTTHGFACHIQTDRIAELMAAADLAIGAGGTATWERCCVGLPALVVAVADNQRQLVVDSALAGLLYAPRIALNDVAGLARHLRAFIENPLLRTAISRNGMNAVDGRGAQRVLRAMGVTRVTLRQAAAGDSKNVFEWRNNPAIRQASRTTEAIDWSTHAKWFASVLADPAKRLLIGEVEGQAVGVVRFDMAGGAAEISIYLVPGRQEQGTGADLLAAAQTWLSKHEPSVAHVNAEVRNDNLRSHRLFASAGYYATVTGYTKRMKR